MLTIEDIRGGKNPSGFNHVRFIGPVRSGHGGGNPWRAEATQGPAKGGMGWYGPRRADPAQAAQDYCDYINGNGISRAPALKTLDKSKRPNGSKRTITEREKRLRAALREELDANPPPRMHDPVCYLVGIKNDIYAVKVGHADYNVYSRLDSLQTGNPRQLVLLGTLPGGIETEKRLHAKHAASNILQEWFRPTHSLLSEFDLTVREYNRKVH